MEEEEAASIYFSRGRTAKKAGDEKTHDLYKHIRKEEEHHRDEFTKRYGEILNEYSPFLLKQSPEAQEAARYIRSIRDPDERQYAQRHFFYLLGYDLKQPDPRPLSELAADKVRDALDGYFAEEAQYSTTVNPHKYWVKIKDPGSSSFTKGSTISYEEFEAERERILERGEKPPSVEIVKEAPPDNGNGGKHLPATIEGEPVPEKYRELIPFVDAPLPLGSDFLTAVIPDDGERKIDVVMKQLQEGVEQIQGSEQFRLFLTTMSKFHDYSVSNLILILIQRPGATRVAGFTTWKDLGRWVKRGERGIAILAPVMAPKGRKEDEGEEEAEIAPSPVYFKVVHVFDVSQTEGKPLPEFEVPVLTGEANEALFANVLELAKSQGVDVSFDSRPQQDPGIKGVYSGKSIWVRPEESRAQQLKSFIHEMAHYYSEGVFRIPRRDAETIAESAAFTVGAHYGFDSGVRSFPYVALWAQDKKILAQNLSSIRKVADTILHALETATKKFTSKSPAVIPSKPRYPNCKEEQEFISDSPELIPFTIDDIGYRDKLDNAFLEAIARARK